MSCGVVHRHGLDPTLLWLWWRLAAIALIGPLAWESPYTESMALKIKKEVGGVKKEDTVHTCNGILLSHKKNKIMPFAATWMQLEIIILSEVRKRKTNTV